MRAIFLFMTFFFALSSSVLADCTTLSGYKRMGTAYWRITAKVPGSPTWERLPSAVPSDISAPMKASARYSTGVAVHIASDTSTLRLCWENSASTTPSFSTWSQTGASGIDIYYRSVATAGQWRWVGLGDAEDPDNNITTVNMGTSEAREYLIYLPQYRRLGVLRVEVPVAYSVAPGPAPAKSPIVVFGTSIVQGSGASRAGAAYPQILGRLYGADTVNLGFAGACRMYQGLVGLIAAVDASVYVLDCFPNMTIAEVQSQMQPFVDALATARPTTPIYIMQDFLKQAGGPNPTAVADHAAKIAAISGIFDALVLTHPNLHLVDSSTIRGSDYEGTFDGLHTDDLGNRRVADGLAALIGPLP